MKEIVIKNCIACPLGDTKFDKEKDYGTLYCRSGKWLEKKGRLIGTIRNYVHASKFSRYPIPDWCPLEDYGTVQKWNEMEKELKKK